MYITSGFVFLLISPLLSVVYLPFSLSSLSPSPSPLSPSLSLLSLTLIQGTQVYNAQKGAFIDLGILDVLQIFGRAGRPQYDTYGEGTIITAHDKLSHYVSLMTRQHPIESRLKEGLRDNLNAEVCFSLGCIETETGGVG